jgi:phage repressor protein C with HTH and peptisase S24 domain
MLEKLALQDYLANDALDFLAMTQVKLVNKVHGMNIHARIKAAREKKGLSMEQLGDIVGVAWQTVQQWENGKTAPKRKRLDNVAAALDTTVEQLLLGDDTNQIQVPMIDAKLSAGSGSLIFSSEASTSLTFKSSYFKRRGLKEDHAYVFPVSGDSMVDAHIIDGSAVLINGLAKHPKSNDIFAIWIDDEIFVKELVKQSDGSWVARSHNKAKNYPDIPIKTANNGIIGLVVWCGFDM